MLALQGAFREHGEVLDALDVETRRFLVETSVLGRFSARLCDEALGRTDSAERLREAPRTSGTTQKLHEKLQPSWTFTKARTRSRRDSACTHPTAPTSP